MGYPEVTAFMLRGTLCETIRVLHPNVDKFGGEWDENVYEVARRNRALEKQSSPLPI
jgi:hypothetical protein